MADSRFRVLALTIVLSSGVSAQCGVEPVLQRIDSGTRGSAGIPLLDSSVPLVGAPYSVRLTNGRANASAILVAGVRVRPVPLPFWGGTLYPDPPVFAGLQLDAQGSATISLPGNVPSSFCGAEFVTQVGVIDPQGTGGVALTRAIRTRFGGRGGNRALVSLRTTSGSCERTNTNLNVIDVNTLKVTRSFSIGRDHLDVAVTDDGKLGVVASFCSPRLVILDMTANPPKELGFVPLPFAPQEIDLAQNRYAIVVSTTRVKKVTCADIVARRVINTIDVPTDKSVAEVAPGGDFAVVGAFNGRKLRRIDIAKNGVIKSGPVLSTPGQIVNASFHPRGDQLLASMTASRLIVVDVSDSTGAMTLRQNLRVGSVHTIVHSPDGNTAYALLSSEKKVQILTRAPTGSWSLGGQITYTNSMSSRFIGVENMCILAGGTRLAIHANGAVVVLDTVNRKVAGTITLTGRDTWPGGIATIGY